MTGEHGWTTPPVKNRPAWPLAWGGAGHLNALSQAESPGALGESMTGVPASRAMHVRNGFIAYSYIATMLLEFVDEKKISLGDKLSKYLPELPESNAVTIKMLANSTSGYADYVYQPAVTNGIYADLPAKRLAIAVITTYQQAAFDSQGDVTDARPAIMSALAKALAPAEPIPG